MRPIGKHVRTVMQILDDLGPCTYRQVWERMDVCKQNANKYCGRAVALGLATVDKTTKPCLYAAVPGWADTAVARRRSYQRRDSMPVAPPSFGAHNPFGGFAGRRGVEA